MNFSLLIEIHVDILYLHNNNETSFITMELSSFLFSFFFFFFGGGGAFTTPHTFVPELSLGDGLWTT